VFFQQEVGSFCFPRKRVGKREAAGAAILMAWLWLCVVPACGQIASYVDERGKRVYVNADEPAPRGSPRRANSAQPRTKLAVFRTGALPQYQKEWLERMVKEAAERHRVDPALVRAVVEAESSWNPSAVSRKGALGLMQLVPGTAQRFGVADVFDPQENLEAGVKYLRTLLERYDGDLNRSLAAYNAGEHAVDRARGVPNFPETRLYVQRITDSYFRPGSGRLRDWWNAPRQIYRMTDERGRLVFTNE